MNARTSQSDPIEVDWLPEGLAGISGRLGMTFAPGKTSSSRFGEPWNRDLDTDLDRMVDEFDTDCLVTLVEKFELEELEIEELFDAASERGLAVFWMGYRDGGVPESHEAVAALVHQMLCRVFRGGRMVVHCQGGLDGHAFVSTLFRCS